jgi:cell division transport system permease protein
MRNKNPDKEIEERIKNITEILKQTPGIKSSYAMSLKETTELLKPWLGDIGKNKLDIPLPRIITVEISDIIPLNIKALTDEIKNYSHLITIETYETWMSEFTKTLSALQTLLGLIIILILTTTGITICYATKSGLTTNKNVIEVMHMVGAQNSYISKHFSNQMMQLSITGGIIGYIISCISIMIIKHFAQNIDGGIISNFNFSTELYWYILLIPITAGIISKLTAIFTINKTLNEMV